MISKIKSNLFLLILVCSMVFIPSGQISAAEFSDSFDTNPYGGSWTNEMSSAVWDSGNGEFDISNDGDTAIRYSQNSPGSIDHEAQVTALAVSSERLVGPGVRFDNTGQNDMYGMSLEGGVVNIYRWNLGARTHLASIASGVTFTIGNYYSMRMSASGGVGSPVVLNVWVQDHGSSKPSDPGWVGNDGSPSVTHTDSSTSGTRFDGSQHSQTGIAGRTTVIQNDNRHDYFKTRAISDRGGVVTPPPPSDTTPPTISSISVSGVTTSGATITWTTNETSSSHVQYGNTTSYGSTANSVGTTLHTVNLTSLSSNTTYNYRISATDASNNNVVSTNATFITNDVVVTPPSDTTSPTVSITTPSGTVSGSTVTVSANASDNVGVIGVQFRLNGSNLGSEDTSSPYTINWDTTSATNATHTITAVARDASGNTTTSSSVSVTVNNTVSIPPLSGAPTPTGTGKYLYVSPTGNDSVTYANNNASNPWRTIGRASWGSTNRASTNAAEAAKSGDVVLVSGGTYDSTEVVNGRFGSVYNPVNQGTVGNYITFVCNGDCTLSAPNANSPVIGASGRNYIKWYADVSQGNSWVINACGMQSGCSAGTVNTTPDTGPVVCHDSTSCHIEGTVIDGTTPVDYTDNWNGIRVENAPSAVLRNNTIRNFRTQSGSRNASGITLYGSANTIVENNQISNVAGGIYFKHNGGGSLPMTNVRARYNNISNAGQCVSWSIGVGSNHFYQNICTDSSFGALITGNGLSSDWIFNNTFSNLSGSGIYLSPNGTGGRYWNNICVSCASALISEGGPMPAENVVDFEHNVYSGYGNFYSGVGGSQTFSVFKSTFPTFEQSLPASIDANPMFISSTDFRLQSGSPARTIGVDILDLDGDGSTTDIIPAGAYITGNEVIGVNTSGASTQPPVTPPSTADLRANNSTSNITITSGNTFSLTWTSTNATSCTVTPGNYTGTSGTQTLSPTATTTYSVSCIGTGGNSTDSITVNVAPQVTTPPVTPLPTTFTNNQRVQTTANLNVRATANGTLLGTQSQGQLGTIVGTGLTVSGTNWWNVNYDSGVDGWSTEQFLQNYVAPTTPAPSNTVIFDDFEYSVGRVDSNAVETFRANGWTGAKTEGDGEPNANGYIYTVNSIPGFSGSFPGINSNSVLALEARSGSEGQSDFYLQLGNTNLPAYDDYIPADVWFQFWMYPQDYGNQQSSYGNRNKFFYACNAGGYPCNDQLWMVSQGGFTNNPLLSWPWGNPSDGHFTWSMSSASGPSTVNYTGPGADPYIADQIGPNNINRYMQANRWTLVKMHLKTNAVNGNTWEMWHQPSGESWVKVAEWIDGVTPGFQWTIPGASVGGHRELRFPTTVGSPTVGQDYWIYMDDFVISNSESSLPVYGSQTIPPSTTFTNNQRVQTTANLNVRATANGTLLGTQSQGQLGTIVGTGLTVSGTNWWNVNYDSGVDGWSTEQFLQNYVAPTTPPVTTAPTTPPVTTTPPTSGGGGSAPSTPTGGGGGGAAPTVPTQTTAPTTPTVTKPKLTRNLYLGTKGTDVAQLQSFLITTGLLQPNLNTGYYGNATKEAVQKYQCATLKLCSGTQTTNGYGVVGTKTRTALTTGTVTQTTTTTTLTTEQRAAIQKQIDALLVLVQQLLVQLQAQGN